MNRYDFDFTWDSTYGLAARMLDDACDDGIVVDLGCGEGVFGTAMSELGRDYVGFDLDAGSVERCRSRGVQVDQLDLRELASPSTVEQIKAAVAGRTVAAVALLDVIEHLPDPSVTFTELGALISELGAPRLVVSIPNVAHVELAAKLVGGRWDVTSTGLLDDTHISLFTEDRLANVTAETGFVEIARDDKLMMETEQAFPAGHPAVERATNLRRYLELVRRNADGADQTYQFVRTYRFDGVPSVSAANDDTVATAEDGRFLTAIVRTQGARAALDDALTCLAAQDDDDLEVLVVVHTESEDETDVVDGVRTVVERYHQAMTDRVRVLHETGGGRSAPLNRGLDEAAGRYVAFLDDDDLVTASWVSEFRRAEEAGRGTVLRTLCLLQEHELVEGGLADYRPIRGLSAPYNTAFEFTQHLSLNQSPICSWAIPAAAIDAFGIRFDDELEVLEDWDLFLRATSLLGVSNRAEYTSIYRRFVDGSGSTTGVEQTTWMETQRMIIDRLGAAPVLVPPGAVVEITLMSAHADLLREQRDAARRELEHLPHALARIDALERSRYWRATEPLRRLSGRRESVSGAVKRRLRRDRSPEEPSD